MGPEEVARLASLAGLAVPEEDLEPLARALEEHAALVAPLLARDLGGVEPAVRFDPRWSTS